MKTGIKIAISALVLAIVLLGFDGEAALRLIGRMRIDCLLLALAFGFPLIALGAWRWSRIAHANDIALPFRQSLRATAESHFFNQAFPATLGGDAYRIWVLSRNAVAPPDAVGCVATDRLIGVLALAVLVGFTQFGLIEYVTDPQVRYAIWVTLAIVISAVVAGVILGRVLARRDRGLLLSKLSQSVGHLKTIVGHPRDFAAVMLAGVVGHCAIVMMFFSLSIGLGVSISAAEALTFFPTVFLLSMMPITVAGWGVREAILITALRLLDVPPTASIALGISFGVCMLIIGIPGAVLWMVERGHAR